MHATPRRAFTLVELLVVIAIIGALIAMLLPSMNKAQAVSQAAVCGSNTRQMSIAFRQACIENRGAIPVFAWLPNDPWFFVLKPYGMTDDVRQCAAANSPGPNGRGSATTSWGPMTPWWTEPNAEPYTGGYAINAYMFRNDGPYGSSVAGNGFDRIQNLQVETPVFVDSPWVDLWPHPTDAWPRDVNDPLADINWYYEDPGSWTGLWRAAVNRHLMAVNIARADGSVARVKLHDLWSLPWHRNYQRTTMTPP